MPKDLGLCEYQDMARKTAIYTHPDYPLGALVEEIGEVFGKISKRGRKAGIPLFQVIDQIKYDEAHNGLREEVEKEMGDVLWQWANLCYELGFDPAEVARKNIDKLQGRQERGTLEGSGDER